MTRSTNPLSHEATLDQIIARRLTQIRESAQITLQEMSVLTGIPEEVLAESETGSEPMSLSRLRTIATALDTSTISLLAQLMFPNQ